jgi:hypothetical protein
MVGGTIIIPQHAVLRNIGKNFKQVNKEQGRKNEELILKIG